MAEDAVIGKKNVPYTEAINYAHKRKVVLPDFYYGRLVGLQRSQAVSVAGLASVEQIKFIVDQIEKVMKEGKTFKDFQDAVKANTLGIQLPAHRLDNIFRTNIQAAYNRGRWEQQTKVADHRPYLMYDALNDGRTRPSHHAMDNTILPRDHGWWKTHYPPNGYRCRCTVISLTEEQARKRGGPSTPKPEAQPDRGWGYNPGDNYTLPVRKVIDTTTHDLLNKVPGATKAAEKAIDAIKAKAEPITLDSVMKRGKDAIDKLSAEHGYMTAKFYNSVDELVVTSVTGESDVMFGEGSFKKVRSGVIRDHVEKHLGRDKFNVAINGSPYTRDGFVDKVMGTIPLPKRWLNAVRDFYDGKVQLEFSKSRAYAMQRRLDPKMSINPDSGDVVAHEFVHLVQYAYPEIQKLAEEMHAKRTAGAMRKRLADLVPLSGYGPTEVTKEDKYFSHYMGREYMTEMYRERPDWRPLEVLTMGVQAMFASISQGGGGNWAMRTKMFRDDRQTAEFILGLLLAYA